jgi:hypothetical protein
VFYKILQEIPLLQSSNRYIIEIVTILQQELKDSFGSLLVLLSLLTLAMSLETTTLPMTNILSQEEQGGEEQQQWLTYESPEFGYSIQYPPDWEALEEINYQNTSSKMFGVPDKHSFKAFGILIEPLEEYLDTNSLKLKTKTIHDHAREQRAYVNSEPDMVLHKSNSTTIGQSHYPAIQVHFSKVGLEEEYRVNTFMVNNGYRYLFYFFAPPLDVPELFPTVERMLASFRITK